MEKYTPFLLLVKITRRNVAGIVQGSFDILHSIGYCASAAEQLEAVNWLKGISKLPCTIPARIFTITIQGTCASL